MEFPLLEPYLPALEEKKRYYLIGGGRAGGRSYFASQYVTASLRNDYFRCAIMRYIQGDIRNSIYQEIIDRLEEQDMKDVCDIREHILRIRLRGNIINGLGFKKSSSDQKAKLKSLAGYTDVVIEEAEEVSEEDFNQLDDSLRTVKADIRIFLLFNFPPKEHWINKRFFNLVETPEVDDHFVPVLKESVKHNTCFIHTTYKDNIVNLNQTTIDNYENYRHTKPDHYWNMIRGYVPSGARGRIYKNWQPITDEEFDALDFPSFYGTDFGFSNDPAGVVEVKMHNDNVYVKELIYEKGLINKRLSERMEQKGMDKNKDNFCDGAEPKSIAELQTYNWNAMPTEKGAGSRKAGVDLLLGKNVYYTESSTNLVTEMEGYCWALGRNKEPTNEPQDGNDHLLDALRGAVFTKIKQPFVGVV